MHVDWAEPKTLSKSDLLGFLDECKAQIASLPQDEFTLTLGALLDLEARKGSLAIVVKELSPVAMLKRF